MKPSCLDLLIVCDLGFILPLRVERVNAWTDGISHACPHQREGPPSSSTTHDRRSFSTPGKVHKAINASVVNAGPFSEPLHSHIISVYFSDFAAKEFYILTDEIMTIIHIL